MEVSNLILLEAVSKFVESSDGALFKPTLGGVNNVVKLVHFEDKEDLILRVYNNGDDRRKVDFEHKVLNKLKAISLPFELPYALNALNDKGTHVILSNGAEAAMFKLIPGELPKLTIPREIGKACAEVTIALSSIEVDNEVPPTPPYFDIYKVHHAINRDLFFDRLESSEFDSVREYANIAGEEIRQIEVLISRLLALELPQQLIHGDLHYDNLLVSNGKVTGVVDFEFCAMDWRAMDLAITLSKYASEPDAGRYFREVIQGYSSRVQLTPEEREAVPDLIILRILSNVVYFVGRAVAGEDQYCTITAKLSAYLKRVEWLRRNRQYILDAFDQAGREGEL